MATKTESWSIFTSMPRWIAGDWPIGVGFGPLDIGCWNAFTFPKQGTQSRIFPTQCCKLLHSAEPWDEILRKSLWIAMWIIFLKTLMLIATCLHQAASCICQSVKKPQEAVIIMVAIQPTYWPLGPKLTVAHHSPTQPQVFPFVAQRTEKFQNNRSKKHDRCKCHQIPRVPGKWQLLLKMTQQNMPWWLWNKFHYIPVNTSKVKVKPGRYWVALTARWS